MRLSDRPLGEPRKAKVIRMELNLKGDRLDAEIADLDRQLSMYARIKELYNVDFDLQVKAIQRRLSLLVRARSRRLRPSAI